MGEIDSFNYDIDLVDILGNDIRLSVLEVERISSDIRAINMNEMKDMFRSANLNYLRHPEYGEVDLLVGYEYADFHPTKKEANGHLLLLENIFGLVLGGKYHTLKQRREGIIFTQVNKVETKINKFFESESLGVTCIPQCGSCKCGQCHPGGSNMSLREAREYTLIEEGLQYNSESKQWVARLPWIIDPRMLPNNRLAAFNLLRSVERKLLKDPKLSNLYQAQMEGTIARTVCRKLDPQEIREYNGPIYYIAHQAVLRPESKSTPCRIVFNSSAIVMCIVHTFFAWGP